MDRVLADIGERKVNHYFSDIVPMENRLFDRIVSMDRPAEYRKAAGLAMADVQGQFSPMVAKRNLAAMTAGASGGNYVADRARQAVTGARALSQAGLGARMGQKERHLAGLQTLVGLGNNQASTAQTGLTDMASQQAAKARMDVQDDWENNAAMGGAAGTALGIGLRGAMAKWGE